MATPASSGQVAFAAAYSAWSLVSMGRVWQRRALPVCWSRSTRWSRRDRICEWRRSHWCHRTGDSCRLRGGWRSTGRDWWRRWSPCWLLSRSDGRGYKPGPEARPDMVGVPVPGGPVGHADEQRRGARWRYHMSGRPGWARTEVPGVDRRSRLRQRPGTAPSVSSQLLLQLLQERSGPEVWMQDVQGCLDHPAQQKLAGGTASDVVGCGPVLEEYPGHLRPEIPGLALLQLVLDGLYHPLGSTIGSGVVRRNQHPADPIPLQPLQVLGAGESGTIVGHNNVRQSLRREDLPQRRNGRARRRSGDWQCLHPLREGVHYHQEVVALEGSRIVHVQAGPGPLWERPGGDLHVTRGSLVLLADLAALHLVSDVLVQARPPNVRPCHHLGLLHARMPRVQQLQDLGPETLWNHHPGTPQQAALLQAQLGGLVALGLVTQLLPSGYRLDHLRQDRVPAGRLRHRSPGEHPRVGPLQQEHVSWLWNGSRHLRQGQAAQGVGRSQVLPRAVDQLVAVGSQRQGPAYHTRRGLHWNRLVRSQQPQQRLVVRDRLELPAPQVLVEAPDPEHERQAFPVELAVALLRRMKSTRSKRHRVFLTILTPVRQDGSYPVRRRIHGEDYRLGRIEVDQHWSLDDQLLAALEGQVLLLLPGPLLTIAKQTMQRL
uniref:Uncharacterized protein n=1 Tax=Ixodes ricinus TaxID=34613 RepID=A0A6B0VD83_IXORI